MTLFPRKPGPAKDQDQINKAKAHRILDRYKAGEYVASSVVDWALRVTGDLIP